MANSHQAPGEREAKKVLKKGEEKDERVIPEG